MKIVQAYLQDNLHFLMISLLLQTVLGKIRFQILKSLEMHFK